jgi:transposase
MGIDILRSTLSHWVIQSGVLLAPLVQRLQNIIQSSQIAYADETTVQVLKELNRKAQSKSYMWFFAGGPLEQRCAVYEYHPTRGGAVAKTFFKDYQGYLHCDGYSGYDDLFSEGKIIGVGCWAHARRYFVKAQQHANTVSGLYDPILKEIQKLYALEKLAKEQCYLPEKLHALRHEKAKPILNALREMMEHHAPQAPPDSPIGKALNYTLKQWPKLIRYLDDPRLEIDNNFSERAMKDFAIGRKNWLFSDNPDGAKAGAVIYSLIQTCKIHRVEPYAYLKYVLAELPTTLNKNIDSLLPFNCPAELLLRQYR